jgi:hypothetical protein
MTGRAAFTARGLRAAVVVAIECAFKMGPRASTIGNILRSVLRPTCRASRHPGSGVNVKHG